MFIAKICHAVFIVGFRNIFFYNLCKKTDIVYKGVGGWMGGNGGGGVGGQAEDRPSLLLGHRQ